MGYRSAQRVAQPVEDQRADILEAVLDTKCTRTRDLSDAGVLCVESLEARYMIPVAHPRDHGRRPANRDAGLRLRPADPCAVHRQIDSRDTCFLARASRYQRRADLQRARIGGKATWPGRRTRLAASLLARRVSEWPPRAIAFVCSPVFKRASAWPRFRSPAPRLPRSRTHPRWTVLGARPPLVRERQRGQAHGRRSYLLSAQLR